MSAERPLNAGFGIYDRVSDSRRAMAKALRDTHVTGLFALSVLRRKGDESFSRTVGKLFLHDFKLNEPGALFSRKKETVKAIGTVPGNDNLKNAKFHTVERDNRPFPIIGGTLISAVDGKPTKDDLYPFEMTPLYSGVPTRSAVRARPPEKGKERLCDIDDNRITYGVRQPASERPTADDLHYPIGGGNVESFGYDSMLDLNNGERPEGLVTVTRCGKKRLRFSLSDVIGISGAAPLPLSGAEGHGSVQQRDGGLNPRPAPRA